MKAIETHYKGYRFRSRLEARWAVFFDAMGLDWEYEPEGFDLNGVRYLPDFRLYTPGGQVIWYEIKPENVFEDAKFTAFEKACYESDFQLGHVSTWPILLSGDPLSHFSRINKDFSIQTICCPRCGIICKPEDLQKDGHDTFVYCHTCDFETPCGGDHEPVIDGFFSIPCQPHKGTLILTSSNFSRHQNKVIAAATKARSARFEHGECPV